MKKLFPALAVALSFFASTAVNATDIARYYGHDDARLKMVTRIVTAPVSTSLKFGSQIVKGATADTAVSVVPEGADFFINFLRSEKPEGAKFMPGDFVVRRSLDTSFILDFKVFLSMDGESYVVGVPSGSGSRLSVIVEGAPVAEGKYVPMSIYVLLARPLDSILKMTGAKVDFEALLASAPQ